MNDASAMSGIERVSNLDCNRNNTFRVQCTGRYQISQSYAIQVFHGNERTAFVRPNFVNGTDIRMIERRRASCFAAKTFEGQRVLGCILR